MNDARPARTVRASAAIGLALRGYLWGRSIGWFFTRPATRGVRAIAITPAGDVVLVRHSYLAGWHLPGGGQNFGEAPQDAVLRELREEIGLVENGAVRLIGQLAHQPNFRRDTVTLAVVDSVRFVFRPSMEIVEAAAFDPQRLPAETGAGTRRRLSEWLAGMPPPANW
jgi:ADP-ribose pyrophosphatase YjhB (NUDIX family)